MIWIKRIIITISILWPSVCGLPLKAAPIRTMIHAFNAGEFTGQLDGRTDLEKYYRACKTLENMIILPYGGVTKRPGTYYVASAKVAGDACRLVPFEYSVSQAYVLEMGDEYVRFYTQGGQVQDGGSPYEIVSPWDDADLEGLRFVKSSDVMYFTHEDYPLYKLVRYDHDDWTLTEVSLDYGPFLDENLASTQVAASAVTGSITMTNDGGLWDANHIGSDWQITYSLDSNAVSGNLTVVDTNSSPITIQLDRSYRFTTHGTWLGTVDLQRSYDNWASWEVVYPVHSESDSNIDYSGDELVADAEYRVYMSAFTSGTCIYSLIAQGYELDGVVRITDVTDANACAATVLHELGGTAATTRWSQGAFSDKQGWPRCISLFEDRLVLAGTDTKSQTVWFSQSDDWENFQAGNDDTDGMAFTIASDQQNLIQWLVSLRHLMLGSAGGEWVMTGGTDTPITPTNVFVKQQSNYGSGDLQGVMVNNMIMFVQRGGRKLREIGYNFSSDSYVARDMTLMSEHVTRGGIVDLDYAKTPDSILWCTLDDGTMATLVYQPDQDVFGWSRLNFGGQVASTCVIPGSVESELWLAVNRTVDSNTVTYIEQVQTRDWGDEQVDAFYVDCGLSFDGGESQTITGISQASPGVVTAVGHGFVDGVSVEITGVSGMTEINGKVFDLHYIDADSFSLRDKTDTIDWTTAAYTAYASGGSVAQVAGSFATLTHLEAETVSMVGDGAYLGQATVSGGAVSLGGGYYNTIHIGLPYTAKLQTMRLNVVGNDGAIQGSSQRIVSCGVRVYQSLGVSIGPSFDDLIDLDFRSIDDQLNQATPLYSGDKRVTFLSPRDTESFICVQSDEPLPMTVLGLMPHWEVNP